MTKTIDAATQRFLDNVAAIEAELDRRQDRLEYVLTALRNIVHLGVCDKCSAHSLAADTLNSLGSNENNTL